MSRLWKAASEKADLSPSEEGRFFDLTGAMPAAPEDNRRRRRFYYRQRALLKLGADSPLLLGVYCRDLSREGIGVISPRQLLPLEQAQLILSNEKRLDVRVRRCVRLHESCYAIGCDFQVAPQGGPSLWVSEASNDE